MSKPQDLIANAQMTPLNKELQSAPAFHRNHDMEAASRPSPPFRCGEEMLSDGLVGSDKPKNRRPFVGFVFLGILVVGAVTCFVAFRSRNSTAQNPLIHKEGQASFLVAPMPTLQISDIKPLSICMGDCDEDSDCGPDLICFQRTQNTPVPGCSGGLEDSSRTDYCIPETHPLVTTSERLPLGRCQGDCDSNEDCGHGLVCYQRTYFEFVPGCTGGSADGSRTDYCVPRSMIPETYMLPMGENLFGNPDDNFGSSVSLSQSQPLLMVVGAVDRGSTGYVSIYRKEEDHIWTLATAIPGDEAGSDFGHAVSMSWDGKYVAVAMHQGIDGGRVKVFELSTTNGNGMSWNQVGDDVLISNPYNDEGDGDAYAVSLSQDGSILAVAQQYYFSTFQRTDSGKWIPLGLALDVGSFGGGSISLSGDGSRVAVNVQPYDVYPYD
ncbi:MAG: hypothetical protein SGBAC_012472, partial [Bacillariaceae sp.]